jgi:pimeloyl-ACP methyl ester carboxylesterase
MSSENITAVLVHGAWADGSSWAKVIARLHHEGINTVTAPLPLTSYEDDVAALDAALERIDGPAVLAGHAYAGAVIGGTRSTKVQALVYVAALAPDEGETVADVFHRDEPHPSAPQLKPDGRGLIWLPEGAFAEAFAQHAPADELAVLAAVQRPITQTCISVPMRRPRWKDLPSWYLVSEQDRMIPPRTQSFMAGRMHAHRQSQPVDHTPGVTAPGIVADLILQAVRATAS